MHPICRAKTVLLALLVGGCGLWPGQQAQVFSDQTVSELPEGIVRPVLRPGSVEPVTDETAKPQKKGALGATIASLGTPTETGLWLKTPLAVAAANGRVSFQGKSIELRLIPIDGEASAGSRLSLQAMQALGIALT